MGQILGNQLLFQKYNGKVYTKASVDIRSSASGQTDKTWNTKEDLQFLENSLELPVSEKSYSLGIKSLPKSSVQFILECYWDTFAVENVQLVLISEKPIDFVDGMFDGFVKSPNASITEAVLNPTHGLVSQIENKNEGFIITVKDIHENSLRLNCLPSNKIEEVKERILDAQRRLNLDPMPVENQRLVYRGRILNNGHLVSDDITTTETTIHVVRANIPIQEDDNMLERGQVTSLLSEKVNSINILLRNAQECLLYATTDGDFNQRRTFEEQRGGVVERPSLPDLGQVCEDLGEVFMKWSHQLHRASNILIDEPRYASSNESDPKFVEHRKIIQNNIDVAKYMGPCVKNLSQINFVIQQDQTYPEIRGQPNHGRRTNGTGPLELDQF